MNRYIHLPFSVRLVKLHKCKLIFTERAEYIVIESIGWLCLRFRNDWERTVGSVPRRLIHRFS